jgi:hypothetical protein
MADLHTRLHEAITTLKALAKAAPSGPWTVELHYAPLRGCRCLSCYEDKPSGWEITEISAPPGHGAFVVFEDETVVRHISANDPVRVLRRCQRDLSVLERHTRDEFGHCFWCSEDGYQPINVQYPCPEIRELAEEYEVSSDDTGDLLSG